jgi:ADP-ribose pyrophosphatase YjhB (NUDIX family)
VTDDRPGPAARTGPVDLAGLRIRSSVRAVVLDPADRILLVRFEFPQVTVWATPGGGVEPGETEEEALHRELDEELGLTDVEVGPHIWSRVHVIPFLDGSWDGQRDHVHLVRVPAFDPRPRLSWEQLRSERLHELRWWTLAELIDAERAQVRFAPRRLPELLTTLLADGPPPGPIETGV